MLQKDRPQGVSATCSTDHFASPNDHFFDDKYRLLGQISTLGSTPLGDKWLPTLANLKCGRLGHIWVHTEVEKVLYVR